MQDGAIAAERADEVGFAVVGGAYGVCGYQFFAGCSNAKSGEGRAGVGSWSEWEGSGDREVHGGGDGVDGEGDEIVEVARYLWLEDYVYVFLCFVEVSALGVSCARVFRARVAGRYWMNFTMVLVAYSEQSFLRIKRFFGAGE